MSNFDRESTIDLLKQHKELTIDMADAFVRGDAEVIHSEEHAVLIIHGCGIPMLWADEFSAGVRAINSIEDTHRYVLHGTQAIKAFEASRSYGHGVPCKQYCRLDRKRFEVPDVCEFKTLTVADLPFVMEHYHRAGDSEYIEWRINEGELQGAYIDGDLAGFIGSHSDGSIGMLEVLPKYRRRGLGTALEYYQMNKHIDKGWTPYGQVFIDNDESNLLQTRVGLDLADDVIAWAFDRDDED